MTKPTMILEKVLKVFMVKLKNLPTHLNYNQNACALLGILPLNLTVNCYPPMLNLNDRYGKQAGC